MFYKAKTNEQRLMRHVATETRNEQIHKQQRLFHHIKKLIRLLSVVDSDKRLEKAKQKELNQMGKIYWTTIVAMKPEKYKPYFYELTRDSLKDQLFILNWYKENAVDSYSLK